VNQNQIWRGLIIAAVLISLLMILIAGISRIGGDSIANFGTGAGRPVSTLENTITLPIVVGQDSVSGQLENGELGELNEGQGGSIDLIIGAAMIVIIIVSGVIFGRRR
jgi:hypothetical protein